jgi:hypothetical protein
MIPVAVSVPENISIQIQMETANWAFGKIRGTPRL